MIRKKFRIYCGYDQFFVQVYMCKKIFIKRFDGVLALSIMYHFAILIFRL